MNAIEFFRENLRSAHEFLEGTVADVPPQLLDRHPGGTANPIGANYAHVVWSEDLGTNVMLKGGKALGMTTWAGRTGLSDLPPLAPTASWHEWARRLRVDLPALRAYAGAVYAATDAHLATLKPDDLRRPVDLSAVGLGEWTVARVLGAMLNNANLHCGEIAALKGINGLKGYPM